MLLNNNPNDPGRNDRREPQHPAEQLGRQIGGAVRDTLGNIVPAVQDAVKDISAAASDAARGGQSRPPQGQNQPPRQVQTRPAWHGTPVRYTPGTPAKNYAGVGEIVAGGVGVAGFGTLALISVGLVPVAAVASPLAAVFGALALGCAAIITHGAARNKAGKRMLRYMDSLQKKDVQSLAELAASVGRSPEEAKKDIKKGIRKGQLPYVWFDKTETTVMLGENNYHLYLQSEKTRAEREAEAAARKARMEQDPEFAELENFRREGTATLKKIRAANEGIEGDEISKKLSRLEETCARIFTYVEQYPQKLPETRRFMSYYLPTTLKLVDKYHQYEHMEVQTPSIEAARADIERSLDTIDDAFNNMLDNLSQEDTLDVTTDIQVLEQMLQREGLTGRQFEIEADQQPGSPLKF